MAISQVQAKSTTYTGGTATQTLLYTPISAGNLVEVYAGNTGSGGTMTCTAPGWTFQTPTTVTDYNGNVLYVFPAYNVPSGTVTITCVCTSGGETEFNVIEWSGVATSAARVQANSNSNINVPAAVTLPGTTSGNLITFASLCIYNNPTAAICSSGSVSGGINNTVLGLLRSGDWQVGAGGSLTGTEQDAGGGAGATTLIMSEYLAAGGGASFVADDWSSVVYSFAPDIGLYLRSSQDDLPGSTSTIRDESPAPLIWMPSESTAWASSPQVEFAPSYLSDDVSGSALPLPVDASAAPSSQDDGVPQIHVGDDAASASIATPGADALSLVASEAEELVLAYLSDDVSGPAAPVASETNPIATSLDDYPPQIHLGDDGPGAPLATLEVQVSAAPSLAIDEFAASPHVVDDVSSAMATTAPPDVVLLASTDDELSLPGTPDEASPSFRPPEVVEDVRPRPSPEEFATAATFSLDDISTGSPSPTFLDPTTLAGASEEIKGLAAIVDDDARAIAQTDSPTTSTISTATEEHVVVVLDEASTSLPVLDGPGPFALAASAEDFSRTFVGDDASTGVLSAEATRAQSAVYLDEHGLLVTLGLDDGSSSVLALDSSWLASSLGISEGFPYPLKPWIQVHCRTVALAQPRCVTAALPQPTCVTVALG